MGERCIFTKRPIETSIDWGAFSGNTSQAFGGIWENLAKGQGAEIQYEEDGKDWFQFIFEGQVVTCTLITYQEYSDQSFDRVRRFPSISLTTKIEEGVPDPKFHARLLGRTGAAEIVRKHRLTASTGFLNIPTDGRNSACEKYLHTQLKADPFSFQMQF